ncbi:MAG TPA: hypothetical protein VG899_03925 [Mycobacteriales bacterium]|nr:hypothetical protein [Mycobacteriales bacterium]
MTSTRTTRVWLAVAGSAVVAAAVVIPIVLTHGGNDGSYTGGPRPVTAAEAERLATMRVTNFEAVGVAFHANVAAAQGSVTVNGDVDFHTLTGYGEVSSKNAASYTIEWNPSRLIAWRSSGRPTAAPAALPVTPPRERALSPSTSGVDTVLALLLGLGESRPDDAGQVRQDGARWLRTATLDGETVDVMQGPSAKGAGHGSDTSLDFWVDRTGHLLRVDAYLSGVTTPSEIDLDPNGYTGVPTSAYLTADSSS